jgi:hypothetical protein
MFNFFNSVNWLLNRKTPNANNLTANDYIDRLRLIALSIFEWDGLPDTCNVRYLETSLMIMGRALFFYDDTKGYLTLRCTPSGELNVYDEPISYTAYATGYAQSYDSDKCVLIRNNYLERPTEYTLMLFASRLTNAERTIDVNVNAQKTPVLIRCDEKDRLTMQNLYKQYEGNEPFIAGGKNLNLDNIKVFKTDAPFLANDLQKYKHEIWNEALTFLGVNNTNTDKRERLTDDEVNANNEFIEVNGQSMLIARQEACMQINKMYNLNVSVRMRTKNEIFEGKEENNDE